MKQFINLRVNQTKNKAKPTNGGIVNNKLNDTQSIVGTISPIELLMCIAQPNGMSFTNSFVTKRSQSNVTNVQVIALDFDNTDEKGETINIGLLDQLLEHPLTDQSMAIYETFNSTKTNPRYRLLFNCSRSLTLGEFNNVRNYLFNHYHDCYPDEHATDPSRIFYGSKNTYLEMPLKKPKVELKITGEMLNYGDSTARKKEGLKSHSHIKNNLSGDEVAELPASLILKKSKTFSYTPEQTAIKDNDVVTLRRLWSHIIDGFICPTDNWNTATLKDRLNCFDLSMLLGVKSNSSFLDLFGEKEDTHPSASIYTSEYGQFYHSFRLDHDYNGVQVLRRLGNFTSNYQLANFLEDVTDINFLTDYQKTSYANVIKAKKDYALIVGDIPLKETKLNMLATKVDNILTERRLKPLIATLYEYASINIPDQNFLDNNPNNEPVFLATTNQITKMVHAIFPNIKGFSTTRTIEYKLNTLALLGFVKKVPDVDLDPEFLKSIRIQMKRADSHMHSTVYQLPINLFESIEDGLNRYDIKEHKGVSTNTSYNTPNGVVIATQRRNKGAERKALVKAYIVYTTVRKLGWASGYQIGSVLFLCKPDKQNVRQEKITDSQLKEVKRELSKLDQYLEGMVIRTKATKGFQQSIKDAYDIDLRLPWQANVFMTVRDNQTKTREYLMEELTRTSFYTDNDYQQEKDRVGSIISNYVTHVITNRLN